MKQYKLNVEYLEAKYNVEIDDADSVAEGEISADVVNIAKRLKNLYV
jgi:hypothetical protein